MNTLSKVEIIRGYSLIRLFKSAKIIESEYFKYKILVVNKIDVSNLKILISVSKRLFKRAVDRNLLKRRIKEVFRLNKGKFVVPNEKLTLINFIYNCRFIVDYKGIENDIVTFICNYINNNYGSVA